MIEVVVALITGVFTVIACIITNRKGSKDIQQKLEVAQAVTDTKIEELTREVREHNNFARRMPVVEEQIKVINNPFISNTNILIFVCFIN